MSDKQAIIDNIEQYTASELTNYIKSGVVTFDELCNEAGSYFSADVRKEVKRLLTDSEETDWQNAQQANTEDVYLNFLRSYPDSAHANEARNAICQLREAQKQSVRESAEDRFLESNVNALIERINSIPTDERINDPDAAIKAEIINSLDRGQIDRQNLLDIIRKDNNLLRASVLKGLIERRYLAYTDLYEIGIDERFIRYLECGRARQGFERPGPLEKINKISTEVYFWGIPSSGKSCALGAVLSVAGNGSVARSMTKNNNCQGYGYMVRLSRLFRSDGIVGTLPEGTETKSTYEMGFDLEDEKGTSHPITCIDLAGELVCCMFKEDAHERMSDDEKEALQTLTNILIDNRTTNRKIHFFVLEYGGENRTYEGLSQAEYLEAALRYIEQKKIFREDTDAIYLMVTKVDKAGVIGKELGDVLKEYIDTNYRGFYQGLERICRDCEINGGIVERIPFSLGQVCFQDYCLFNEKPAANVVKKLLTRSKGFKTGKFQKFLNIFKR